MTTDHDESKTPAWPKLHLRAESQPIAAALTALSLLAIALWCLWQWRQGGRLIDIEQAEPVAIDYRIDINTADWPELALLPNIGEQLARRIVADRQANGPFRDLNDLARVRGIGPRTIESLEPFLQPLMPVEATAGSPQSVTREAGN